MLGSFDSVCMVLGSFGTVCMSGGIKASPATEVSGLETVGERVAHRGGRLIVGGKSFSRSR